MSMTILRKLLADAIEKIDNNTCPLDEESIQKAIDLVSSLTVEKTKLSKYQACAYLGISRATFDNLVKEGKLPKGKKESGFKELFWYKEDLQYK